MLFRTTRKREDRYLVNSSSNDCECVCIESAFSGPAFVFHHSSHLILDSIYPSLLPTSHLTILSSSLHAVLGKRCYKSRADTDTDLIPVQSALLRGYIVVLCSGEANASVSMSKSRLCVHALADCLALLFFPLCRYCIHTNRCWECLLLSVS